MDTKDLVGVRRALWAAADEMRANSTLGPAEYRGSVLGLIFLAYAEHRFEALRPELAAKATARNPVSPDAYKARSVLFVPDEARSSYWSSCPTPTIWALPPTPRCEQSKRTTPNCVTCAQGLPAHGKSVLTTLLRLFAPLPRLLSGDAFGLIYEDFLSNFALIVDYIGVLRTFEQALAIYGAANADDDEVMEDKSALVATLAGGRDRGCRAVRRPRSRPRRDVVGRRCDLHRHA